METFHDEQAQAAAFEAAGFQTRALDLAAGIGGIAAKGAADAAADVAFELFGAKMNTTSFPFAKLALGGTVQVEPPLDATRAYTREDWALAA